MNVKKEIVDSLLLNAKIARDKAYAPYSHYSVGAALLTERNNIYSGCNIENSSFGATICAERVAIVKAISEEGNTLITHMLVYAKDPSPCGICRQFLSNFCSESTIIILSNTNNTDKFVTFKELFPYPFVNF
jgi:cytidine deaminase